MHEKCRLTSKPRIDALNIKTSLFELYQNAAMAAIDYSIGLNSTTHHITNRNPSSNSSLFGCTLQNQLKFRNTHFTNSLILPLKCSKVENFETHQKILPKIMSDPHSIDQDLLQKLVYDALVWSSLHGLVVGDKNVQVCMS